MCTHSGVLRTSARRRRADGTQAGPRRKRRRKNANLLHAPGLAPPALATLLRLLSLPSQAPGRAGRAGAEAGPCPLGRAAGWCRAAVVLGVAVARLDGRRMGGMEGFKALAVMNGTETKT